MRAFIAITIPQELLERLEELQKTFFDVGTITFVKKEHMHLTLKFFRDVSEQHIGIIKERLRRVNHLPFEIALHELGVFPDEHRPRVIWVGMKSGELSTLQEKIDKALEEHFAPEERFHAHLTLGRIKHLSDVIKFKELLQRKPSGGFLVKEFSLIQSIPHKDGYVYIVLENYSLSPSL